MGRRMARRRKQAPDGRLPGHQVTDGEDEAADGPLRRCVATGERLNKAGLIRLVVAPDGNLVADLEEKLPGRGVWITADRAQIGKAVERKLFARALESAIKVEPELADRIEAGLVERCIALLGLARRAGAAVAGFEKVGEATRTGRLLLRLEAADAGETARGKAAGARKAGFETADVLTADEMGRAFDRPRTVHAAFLRGAGGAGESLAERMVREMGRLAGFRVR